MYHAASILALHMNRTVNDIARPIDWVLRGPNDIAVQIDLDQVRRLYFTKA